MKIKTVVLSLFLMFTFIFNVNAESWLPDSPVADVLTDDSSIMPLFLNNQPFNVVFNFTSGMPSGDYNSALDISSIRYMNNWVQGDVLQNCSSMSGASGPKVALALFPSSGDTFVVFSRGTPYVGVYVGESGFSGGLIYPLDAASIFSSFQANWRTLRDMYVTGITFHVYICSKNTDYTNCCFLNILNGSNSATYHISNPSSGYLSSNYPKYSFFDLPVDTYLINGAISTTPEIFNCNYPVDFVFNSSNRLSAGTYSIGFKYFGNYGTSNVTFNGKSVDGVSSGGRVGTITFTFTLDTDLPLNELHFNFTGLDGFVPVSSSVTFTPPSSGGGSGSPDLSGFQSSVDKGFARSHTDSLDIQDHIDSAAGNVSSAVQSASDNISDSVRQAQEDIINSVDNFSDQQHADNESLGALQESIAQSREAAVESRHDEERNGWDKSSSDDIKSTMEAAIDEYDQAEGEIMESIQESLEFDLQDPGELFSGDVGSVIVSMQGWFQILYESLGDYNLMWILPVTLCIALILVGRYRFGKDAES